MEDLAIDPSFWQDRRVLVTGHTGFKGAWLSLWLHRLGAKVYGLSLPPNNELGIYVAAGIARVLKAEFFVDLNNTAEVRKTLKKVKPDCVFHLAAQSLVLSSYEDPMTTLQTNIMGTAGLLLALIEVETAATCVVVTSDKCYQNLETNVPFVESDPLGGYDPYCASKACQEIVAKALTNSFLKRPHSMQVLTARAGNVIGGGDYATNRLIPDFIAKQKQGGSLELRHPHAIRPWQFILDPLYGYLLLAERSTDLDIQNSSWNFAPPSDCQISVESLVTKLNIELSKNYLTPVSIETVTPKQHESKTLLLDATKAKRELGWMPRASLAQSVAQTIAWYAKQATGVNMALVCQDQISEWSAGFS